MAAAPFADVEAPALSMTPGAQVAPADIGGAAVRAARLERRDAAAGLSTAGPPSGAPRHGTVWLAWTTPAQGHRRSNERSWYRDVDRCVLDDDGDFQDGGARRRTAERLVLLRGSRIDRSIASRSRTRAARSTRARRRSTGWSASCRTRASRCWPGSCDRRRPTRRARNDDDRSRPHGRQHALVALALTADPSADGVLEEFVAASNPRWLRRDAAFWLGAARGDAAPSWSNVWPGPTGR